MSRGLGALQRDILAALNRDHEADFVSEDWHAVYDLRAVKRTLAARGRGRPAFEASFSRAIGTLVRHGLLRKEWRPGARSVDHYHTAFVSRRALSVKSPRAVPGGYARMARAVRQAFAGQPVPGTIQVALHGLGVAIMDLARKERHR